ncbi:hypothetical protein IQ270_01830 [Microcoleus sp. LEGE 07076]|uniref:hypothetical protein n=1 Tax=Microcoleus sp. LEGE 07076 TaxID=915322 RepID=UPI001880DB75|nr:hypothetical protein [Microcoleus sp. LEGE 07076]MBE9183499.1 hypothetical protein [Microcoleus sp. LEGE 07076]
MISFLIVVVGCVAIDNPSTNSDAPYPIFTVAVGCIAIDNPSTNSDNPASDAPYQIAN